MTFIGSLIPWILFKQLEKQTAASNTFEVAGEHLEAIRATDAFYLIELPTRATGIKRLLQFLAYLLPTSLILRHRRTVDFTVDAHDQSHRSLPVWQIDPSMAIIEYFSPAQMRHRNAEFAIDRAAFKAYTAKRKAREQAEREALIIENTIRTVVARQAANRAAAALKISSRSSR